MGRKERQEDREPLLDKTDRNTKEKDISLLPTNEIHKRHVNILRPVYTESEITKLYKQESEDKSIKFRLKRYVNESCTCANLVQRLLSFFPIISWLPKYSLKKDLLRDLSAGLTLGVMQIPQGMAYGMLTTLPPIYGLYVSLIPVLIYFFMGSSHHLSIGTFAIISLMVGEVVDRKVSQQLPLPRDNTTTQFQYDNAVVELRLQYAVTTSFLVGAMQLVFGFLRFGFITIFLSDPLISGFTTGAAFYVFSSQVKHLVGMSIPREETSGIFSLFKLYIYIFKHISDTNIASLIIGVVATIILFVVKHYTQKYKDKIKFPIPAELIVVVLGTGLSYGLDFNTKFDVSILEKVPKGLPPTSAPQLEFMTGQMIVDCISIAIVSYAISISIAKAFAKKNKYKIDANQELYAYGAVNVIGSFLSCFVAAASLSRSMIQENLGSTQLAGLFSCVLIVLTLTVLAPLFVYLPNAILAAIVLVALKGLFKQFSVVSKLMKVSKIDTLIWIFSFLSVFLLGVDIGLAAGLVMNLLAAVVRTSRPTSSMMGQVKETEIYMDTDQNKLHQHPGVKIFQFHAPLFFANVEYFQETLYERTINPTNCVIMDVPACYRPTGKNETNANSNGKAFYVEINNADTKLLPMEDLSKEASSDHSSSTSGYGALDSYEMSTELVQIEDRPLYCPLHTVILDCSQISYTDTMGISVLGSICTEYKIVGVNVYLANCPGKLLTYLHTGGFLKKHGAENIFVTIHDAVQHTLSKNHLKGICDPSLKDVNTEDSYEYVLVHQDSSSKNSEDNIQVMGFATTEMG